MISVTSFTISQRLASRSTETRNSLTSWYPFRWFHQIDAFENIHLSSKNWHKALTLYFYQATSGSLVHNAFLSVLPYGQFCSLIYYALFSTLLYLTMHCIVLESNMHFSSLNSSLWTLVYTIHVQMYSALWMQCFWYQLYTVELLQLGGRCSHNSMHKLFSKGSKICNSPKLSLIRVNKFDHGQTYECSWTVSNINS